MEIWKDIEGYESRYQVSTKGNVKRLKQVYVSIDGRKYNYEEKLLNISKNNFNGYLQTTIGNGKDTKKVAVHRLVAETFIENPENKLEVNHIDGNKENNNIENLEWNTRIENVKHAQRNNLINKDSEKRKKQAAINARKGAVKNFIKCVEYDLQGKLIQIHESSTHTGDGKKYMPDRLQSTGSIWRNYDLLIIQYGCIPNEIDIDYDLITSNNKTKKIFYKMDKNKNILSVYEGFINLPIQRGKVIFSYNHNTPDSNGDYWLIKIKK